MLQPYAHHALVMGRLVGTVLTTTELAGAFSASIAKITAAIQEVPNDGPLDPIILNSLRRQFDRMSSLLAKPNTTFDEVRQSCTELSNRLYDALIEEQFLHVPVEMARLYNGGSLFGEEVEAKFQKISEDIIEAAKCLALGRYTASVFHLMRVMENAVKTLGTKLSVTVIDKNNVDIEWGKILANLSGPIEKMPKGDEKEKWSAAHSLLVHVKIAWRNPTMHPKQTYTEEQAKEIFSATRAFMNSMTSLI
jgi:hypothetical protein